MTAKPVAHGGPGGRGDPVLTVTNLSVQAGSQPLVDGVSFAIGKGERVGIIGASGSGKTLTCLAIAGLLPSQLTASGTVRQRGFTGNLLDSSERELARVRGRLSSMVFQEPMTALNPTMRVGRQVAECMKLHGASSSSSERRERTLSLLSAVDLAEPERIARSYPHELSGGQRQRVVLAMALANSPELLICDEPTTALDVTVQARVLALIDRRTRELGSALLFISHDLPVVATVCDYLLVMWQGRIVEHGTVTDLLAAPQHEHTRRLIADSAATGSLL